MAEFTGRVIEVTDRSGKYKNGDKAGQDYRAAQIVVEEDGGQFPQVGVFDLFGEKVTYPSAGDMVSVEYNLKGSQYEGKWYGRLNAWKVQVAKSAQAAGDAQGSAYSENVPDPLASGEDDDTLPF